MRQLAGVSGFFRTVSEHAIFQHHRRQRVGHQRCGGDDESVDQDQHAALGRAEHRAGQHRDLETAVFGERDERLARAAAPGQRPLEQRLLACQTGVVEAGAATGHRRQRCVDQAMGQQRSRAGIADAHFAEADDTTSAFGQPMGDRTSSGNRCFALGATHRRAFDETGGAMRKFGTGQSRNGTKVVRDAGIDDLKSDSESTREYVDCRAATQEIGHHLPGHFLWIGRNAVPCRAMICSEYKHLGIVEAR